VHVAGDGEEPWGKTSVGTKAPGMLHQPQPGLFEQVFRDFAPVRQSGEKVEQAGIECLLHRIERRGIARSKAADELELALAIHPGNNAKDQTT